jgi:hypothetical protein
LSLLSKTTAEMDYRKQDREAQWKSTCVACTRPQHHTHTKVGPLCLVPEEREGSKGWS